MPVIDRLISAITQLGSTPDTERVVIELSGGREIQGVLAEIGEEIVTIHGTGAPRYVDRQHIASGYVLALERLR